MKHYTIDELIFIKEHANDMTLKQLHSHLPHRTLFSLKSKIYDLGLRPVSTRNDWSTEEIQLLREKYSSSSKSELLDLFPHRNELSIINKARNLKLKKSPNSIRRSRMDIQNDTFWTSIEDNILIEYYYDEDFNFVQKLLPKRTSAAIKVRAIKLGLMKSKKVAWTKEMEQFLINNYFFYENISLLTESLNSLFNTGKSYNSVNSKMGKLGLNMTGAKTISDNEFISVKKLVEKNMTDLSISQQLDIKPSRVKTIRCKLGLQKVRRWSKKDLDYLREYYPDASMKDIKKHIKRSVKMIHWKAAELDLHRRIEIPQCSSDIYSKNLSEIWSRAKAEEKHHQGVDWRDYEPMSHEEVIYLYEFFDGKCAYCQQTFIGITFDHFIAMTSGGRLTKCNTILCCHSCNTSKQATSFEKWLHNKNFKEAIDKKIVLQKVNDYFDSLK